MARHTPNSRTLIMGCALGALRRRCPEGRWIDYLEWHFDRVAYGRAWYVIRAYRDWLAAGPPAERVEAIRSAAGAVRAPDPAGHCWRNGPDRQPLKSFAAKELRL